MSIAKYKPGTQQPTGPLLPKVEPDNYKGVIHDDKFTQLKSLAAYVEGYPLTVDYYGQILGENNDPREIDPAQSGVYQQYTKLHKFDIRLDSPIDHSNDSGTGLSTVVGVANIHSVITPNTYDYFVARTTRGILSLFRITNVQRLVLNRDSIHRCDFQLVGYVDRGDAKIAFDNLESKVKRKFFYHGDRLIEGLSPVLKEEEHHHVENLKNDYEKILQYFMGLAHNVTYQTLVVPGQSQGVYDMFLTEFILKIISVQDHPLVNTTKQLSSDNDRYMKQPQFWKAIAERNEIYIHQANKYMGLVNRRQFLMDNYIGGAGLSMIDSYIYPLQVDSSTRLPADPSPKNGWFGLQDTAGPNGQICSRGDNTFKSATGDIPLYKPVLCDMYYVLSRDFYENQDNWSLLEKVTWDYLENKSLQLDELQALAKQYYSLARLEQFYYGPLLIMFLRESRRNQYTHQ